MSLELNRFNVPRCDASMDRMRLESFLHSCQELVSLILSSLGNWHSYIEQRAKLYPCDSSMESISQTCVDLSAILLSHGTYMKPMQKSIDHLFMVVKNGAGFLVNAGRFFIRPLSSLILPVGGGGGG